MNNKKTLTEIFDEEGGDKGSIFKHENSDVNLAHNYTKFYEELMSEHRNHDINLLEIGLWCPYFPGASVRAWNRYFTNFKYYGVDIVDCTHLDDGNKINIEILDQKSESQILKYLKNKPEFDFIIDDGCHEEDGIVISFGNFFPKLKSGGYYIIEDLHVVNKENLYKLSEKKFESRFLSKDKLDYINSNIESCVFLCDEKLCVINKK